MVILIYLKREIRAQTDTRSACVQRKGHVRTQGEGGPLQGGRLKKK